MKTYFKIFVCVALWLAFTGYASAQDLKNAAIRNLPAPDKISGKPLMQALNLRKSERNLSNKPLSAQELSNLLWATWGINRADGHRTAPTAMNKQNVQVYAVLPEGVWLYDAKNNSLVQVLASDETKNYSAAGVTLLYAADATDDFSKMHLGSLYQNAGLYCASAELANVVKATGKDKLKGKLQLPKSYEVMIIQSIGYAR